MIVDLDGYVCSMSRLAQYDKHFVDVLRVMWTARNSEKNFMSANYKQLYMQIKRNYEMCDWGEPEAYVAELMLIRAGVN